MDIEFSDCDQVDMKLIDYDSCDEVPDYEGSFCFAASSGLNNKAAREELWEARDQILELKRERTDLKREIFGLRAKLLQEQLIKTSKATLRMRQQLEKKDKECQFNKQELENKKADNEDLRTLMRINFFFIIWVLICYIGITLHHRTLVDNSIREFDRVQLENEKLGSILEKVHDLVN
jgi:vacuolar-type H+-ATPase subunit I/STV1